VDVSGAEVVVFSDDNWTKPQAIRGPAFLFKQQIKSLMQT